MQKFKDGTEEDKPDDGDDNNPDDGDESDDGDDNKPGNGGDSNSGQEKPHSHNYEWKVVSEATAGQDGEEIYYCTICGNITARQPISAFGVYNKEVLAKITTAAQGATVEIITDTWMSYPAYILKVLEDRPDVTLVTKFLYKGKKYSFTIPTKTGDGKTSASGKATGTNQLTEEGVNWYGYLYLGGKYGLTEITEK